MDMELNMSDFANILYQQDIDLGVGVGWPLNFEATKQVEVKQVEPVKQAPPTQQYIVDGETGEYLPVPIPVQSNIETKQQETDIDDFLSLLGDIEQKDEMLNSSVDISELQSLIETKHDGPEKSTENLFNDMVDISGLNFNNGIERQPDDGMQWQLSYPSQPGDEFYSAQINDIPQMVQNNQQPQDQQMMMDFGGISPSGSADSPLDGVKQSPTDPTVPGHLFFNPNAEIRDVIDELENLNSNEFIQKNDAFNNPPNAPFIPPPLVESVEGGVMGGTSPASVNSGNFGPMISQDFYESDSGISVDSNSTFTTDTNVLHTMLFQQDVVQNKVFEPPKNHIVSKIMDQHVPEDNAGTKSESKESQRDSRDLKKAIMMNIPFTMDQIIHSSVEEYNALLSQANLNAEQQSLVRDIRRRGKNKVAAQNCRKRKIETIDALEKGVDTLHQKREKLMAQKAQLEMKKDKLKEKYTALYKQIFRSLRDDNGKPYDPRKFRLEQVEGAIILAPVLGLAHNNHGNETGESEGRKSVAFFDLTKVKIEKPE